MEEKKIIYFDKLRTDYETILKEQKALINNRYTSLIHDVTKPPPEEEIKKVIPQGFRVSKGDLWMNVLEGYDNELTQLNEKWKTSYDNFNKTWYYLQDAFDKCKKYLEIIMEVKQDNSKTLFTVNELLENIALLNEFTTLRSLQREKEYIESELESSSETLLREYKNDVVNFNAKWKLLKIQVLQRGDEQSKIDELKEKEKLELEELNEQYLEAKKRVIKPQPKEINFTLKDEHDTEKVMPKKTIDPHEVIEDFLIKITDKSYELYVEDYGKLDKSLTFGCYNLSGITNIELKIE